MKCLKKKFFCVRELYEDEIKLFDKAGKHVVWMRFNPTHAMALNFIKSVDVDSTGIRGVKKFYGNEERFEMPWKTDRYVICSEQWGLMLSVQEMSERLAYDLIANYPMNDDLRIKEVKMSEIPYVIEAISVKIMPDFPYSPLGYGGVVTRTLKETMTSPCSRTQLQVCGDLYTRYVVTLVEGQYLYKSKQYPIGTTGHFYVYTTKPGKGLIYVKDEQGETALIQIAGKIMEAPYDGEYSLVGPLNSVPLNIAIMYKEKMMNYVYSWITLPEKMHRAVEIDDNEGDGWREPDHELIIQPIDVRNRRFEIT